MLYTNAAGAPCALVSNIQKYTIHDGPGIRTEIFFTGCTMHCLWCSNPETIAPGPQIGCYPAKCLSLDKCTWCVKACPEGGRPLEFENGVLKAAHMTAACTGCFKCVDACPSRALKRWGELMTIDDMLKAVVEDRSFYQKTGGGVTLNGGEVLVQWEVAAALLEACKKAGINTCVETALNCPREHMEAVYQFTDLVIIDIKHMDSEKHRSFSGAGNALILENIKRTAELGKKLVIRTPVVPGYNGDEANIRATGAFIRDALGNKIVQYQLLPYRKMGTEKYDALGIPYPMGDYQPPERCEWEQELLRLADILVTEYGVPAVAGSGSKLEI
ncbi:pyruvate formate lyase activating enzyme [Sporobacter termitidis DSM 10068]|uniref:Pyruvate formate lyase activating enzyme n=1 Tax=Sporobacter termitidis DSM 10068 TaxID=1123282 RepID=A0A1M5Y6R5_9FIRM|nr:glycyl-radical enzyme activating protein [Sporobacter termitidis]SHI07747.1 pyruvate formate lyase activating enzyme [Sporobacter termitidis DSM 10068]